MIIKLHQFHLPTFHLIYFNIDYLKKEIETIIYDAFMIFFLL